MSNLKQIQLDAIALAVSKTCGYELLESFLPETWEITGQESYLLQWIEAGAIKRTPTTGHPNWVLMTNPDVRKPDEYYLIERTIREALFEAEYCAKEIGLDAN
jgi:hypothetical protein